MHLAFAIGAAICWAAMLLGAALMIVDFGQCDDEDEEDPDGACRVPNKRWTRPPA